MVLACRNVGVTSNTIPTPALPLKGREKSRPASRLQLQALQFATSLTYFFGPTH
jgi:hypothetical protein